MRISTIFTLSFLLITASIQVFGQKASVGASLQLFLENPTQPTPFTNTIDGEKWISVLIEAKQPIRLDDFHKTGLQLRSVFGSIATADIPLKKIIELSNHPSIKRIELPLLFEKQDTTMKRMTMVDKVHKGLPPLTKGFFGSNTLIGIIDDGLDITHPEFLDSSGNPRVVAYWNMDRRGNPPTGFTYGSEISKDSIGIYAKNYSFSQQNPYYYERLLGFSSHGTSVAGLAAGKEGVASGADIGVVALTAFTDTLLRSDRLLDGIQYLYQKAVNLNKKCIINISLGTSWGGPHDGKTLVEKAIDQYASEKPDLLIVSSAGNDGNNFKHWGGFPIHKDSSFNFFYCTYAGQVYVSIPKGNSKDISVSVTDTRSFDFNKTMISRDSILGQTPFFNIGKLIDSNTIGTASTKLKNGSPSSNFLFSASHYNEDYDELIIDVKEFTSSNTQSDRHLYRLIFKGEGKMVHVYYPFWNLHPAFIFNNNPLPADSSFRMSDNQFTTIIPTNAYSVLSVGAYNLRQCYVNIQGKVVGGYSPCQLTYFTSRGPTFDGRQKPEIIAPGENVKAPARRFETFHGHDFFLDSTHVMFSGTSASSPIVAGMAALLWEQFPNASPTEIKQKLTANTYSDNYATTSGPIPNFLAGYGKADAFKAATGIATWHDSLCRPVTCIGTYNPNPIPPINNPPINSFFRLINNPAGPVLQLVYRTDKNEPYCMYDIAGRMVAKGVLPYAPGAAITSIDIGHFSMGYYLFRLGTLPAKIFLKR